MALNDEHHTARQRKRSIMIALILVVLVVLFFAVTLVRFGDLLANSGAS